VGSLDLVAALTFFCDQTHAQSCLKNNNLFGFFKFFKFKTYQKWYQDFFLNLGGLP